MFSLPGRIARRLSRFSWTRESFQVYVLELASLPPAPVCPPDIQFRLNCPHALSTLAQAGNEYDLDGLHRDNLEEQLSAGEWLASGWHGEKLVFYGWVQFRKRRLARMTSVSIGEGSAFIYRCFTHPPFRGLGIYPGGLHFICEQLAAKGYKRVFIDHQIRNVASGKGIQRAGFRPAGVYQVKGIRRLKWAACDASLRELVSGSAS